MRSQAIETKAESARLTAEAKQEFRDQKQQMNQDRHMEKICSINSMYSQFQNRPSSYAEHEPHPRSKRKHRPSQYQDEESEDDMDQPRRKGRESNPKKQSAVLALSKWSREKVQAELEVADLQKIYEHISEKGLGTGLGLSTISSEDMLQKELAEFVTSKQMCNIQVKSLFTLITAWKKVDFLRANACAWQH